MYKVIMIVTVIILSISSTSLSQEHVLESLRGIDSVMVAVEISSKYDLSTYRITQERLKVDAELMLRKARIKVTDKVTNDGYLLIELVVIKASDYSYALSYCVDYRQPVFLVRDTNIWTWGSTWGRGGVILRGEQLMRDVRDILKDNVDEFINDYLSVNDIK